MFCRNCGAQIGDQVRFCPACGNEVRPAAPEMKPASETPSASIPPLPPVRPAAPAAPAATEKKEKKKSKLPLLIGIGGGSLLLLALILVLLFVVIIPAIKKNAGQEITEDIVIPAGFEEFSSEDLGISFLYPSFAMIKDRGTEGVYVYPTGERELPSILITVLSKKSEPERYFKSYLKELKKDYDTVEEDKILQADVEDKDVYMLRAEVEARGTWTVMDRFIETDGKKTVEYTVETAKAMDADPVVKGIIESLHLDADYYENAVKEKSKTGWNDEPETKKPEETKPAATEEEKKTEAPTEKEATREETKKEETTTKEETTEEPTTEPDDEEIVLKEYSSDEVNLSISMPDILDTQDIEIGFFGVSDGMIELCAYEDTTQSYFMIYNAEDILILGDKDLSVLADVLFVDGIKVNSLNQTTLGGLNGYQLDVELQMSGFTGTGNLYVLSPSNNIGAYFLYYAVDPSAGNAAALKAAGEESLKTFAVSGEPNDYGYQPFMSQNQSFAFVMDPDALTDAAYNEDQVVLNMAADDGGEDGQIIVQKNDYHDNDISTADEFMKQYASVVGLSEDLVEDYEMGGRYPFKLLTASYDNDDGEEMTMYLVACADESGYIYTIYSEDTPDRIEEYELYITDIVWSFRYAQ